MTFGQTVKKLRREANMTQEALAETLSISGQAVSRWENDLAMPDISLLPILANLFNVTTDHLLGVDITRKQERIRGLVLEAEALGKAGHKREAADRARAGLAEHPGSYELMAALQYHLYGYAGQLDREARTPVIDEVIALGEKILAGCTDDRLRHGAIRWLCHCYAARGEGDKAERLANTMPEPWLSRPGLLGVIRRGDRQYAAKRTEISQLLSEAIAGLETLNVPLDDGRPALTPEEQTRVARKALALVDILCEDGDYGGYDAYRGDLYRTLFALALEAGRTEEALAHLETTVAIVTALDTGYDKNATHTSLLLRGDTYGDFSFGDTENHSMMLLGYLRSQGYAAALEADPRGRALLERLEALAGTR